ncbi:MAG TPA: hypothetical protein VNN08_07030, partial [Thermoanaerobaculia bacterium]|nr:hypothetical protein [Thermoanaerobaculia bacterium]
MSLNGRPRSRLLVASVAALLYFSEGLPFGIVNDLLPVYLRVHHVTLTTIGFLSTVASAWTLKVFWSPLIDAFGTYRRWIVTAVLAMAICMFTLAVMPEVGESGVGSRGSEIGAGISDTRLPTHDSRLKVSEGSQPRAGGRSNQSSSERGGTLSDSRPPTPDPRLTFWILITIFAIASATQDLAVDAFTIRATPAEFVGPVNSIRVAAYRTALIVGGGGLVALSGVIGWRGSFATSGVIAVIVLVIALRLPDDRDEHVVMRSRGLAVSGQESPRDDAPPKRQDRKS